jgi:hypothetical protein
MVGFNGDMDRYLRDRKRDKVFGSHGKRSWFDKIFAPRQDIPQDDLSRDEASKLERMEHEIEEGAVQLKHVHDMEEDLEERQEERVSFYQKLRNLFTREHELEHAEERLEMREERDEQMEQRVQDDFKALARIQIKWMDRLPTRVKEEFKSSDDYLTYREILQRRGVVKK